MSVFEDGDQGSLAKFQAALEDVRSTGSAVLTRISESSEGILLNIERELSLLNAKSLRASRIKSTGVAAQFLTTDLLDVDLSNTLATIRISSGSVSLMERSAGVGINYKTPVFSSSQGSVQQFTGMYQVTSSTAPTGSFLIEMTEAETFTLGVLEIVSTPANPIVVIQYSADGVIYQTAAAPVVNGYQVTFWLSGTPVKFLKVMITPSHPDTLGGNAYTFGITDLSALSTSYQLRSQFQTLPVPVTPGSASLVFEAEGSGDIQYSLSWDGLVFQSVSPGDTIAVPGTTAVVKTPVSFSTSGLGSVSLPASVYLNSMSAVDANGLEYGIAANLNQNLSAGALPRIRCSASTVLTLTPLPAQTTNLLVSYVYGPASLNVIFRAILASQDAFSTPLFLGASLRNS